MKTCLNKDCPERNSVCCGKPATVAAADEGTRYYACAGCGKEFISGKCTARISPLSIQDIKAAVHEANHDQQSTYEQSVRLALLSQLLAEMETLSTAQECRRLLKEYFISRS